ncbi:MAG: carboxypeptidase M32, partial [Phycisphaerales bacterium]
MSTTATLPKHYSDLIALKRKSGTLGSIAALVSWDQETYMPPAGARARAEQASVLAGIMHERRTSKELGELIAKCEQDPELTHEGSAEAANIREMRRDYDLATKLPNDLVEALAKAQSEAQECWKHARKNNDFPAFAPALTEVLN